MARTYRIAAFAKLAGVTVRTLHHYDRMGLLTPSSSTEAGYRLYTQRDLLRLQQILTLKWMGFALKQIKALLDDPAYDLRASLAIQKAAVEAEIARLQGASAALDRALATVDATGAETLDAETVSAIILGVSGGDGATWMRRYYSDDAWRGLQTRWLAYPPEEMARVAQAWADLHAAFAVHRGAPPDSPAVQRLAAQMDALIEAFTGGDPDTLAGLERFSADAEAGALPPGFEGYAPYEGVDAETRKLMREAWQIHRRRRKK